VALVLAAVGLSLCLLPWLDRLAITGPGWLHPIHEVGAHGRVQGLLLLAVFAGVVIAAVGVGLGLAARQRAKRGGRVVPWSVRWACYLGITGLVAFAMIAGYQLVYIITYFPRPAS
jgi:hypothetical protein